MGIIGLSHFLRMVPQLNIKWDLITLKSIWKARFCVVWKSFIEPKKVFFSWSLLYQGLTLGERLVHFCVAEPKCAFCMKDSLFYTYFDLVNMQVYLGSGCFPFLPYLCQIGFPSTMLSLGDTIKFTLPHQEVWHMF